MEHQDDTAVKFDSYLMDLIWSLDKKFQVACNQLVLLDNLIQELQVRYDRAVSGNCVTFSDTLRLRLCTVEGVRNMVHAYATNLANQLVDLDEAALLSAEPVDVERWRNIDLELMTLTGI